MALNSVNTNTAATIALQSLELTASQLAGAQKQISTGYRVADATDDGAAYAIAQKVRSDVGAIGAANTQLNGVQGLVSTTLSALNDISNTLGSARDVLVQLASENTESTQRSQYIAQYQSLIANVKSDLQDAAYNGETLVGNITGSVNNNGTTISRITVVRNEIGSTYGIATFSGSVFLASVNFSQASLANATTVATLISNSSTGATFINAINTLGTQLNTYGSDENYLTNQVNYNSDKINALNGGLGSLVDADLAKESAALQSLQIRQQLGTQALSIANQAPQSLLSLFK